MNLIIILFLCSASCAGLPSYENDFVISPKHLEFYKRGKRGVAIRKGDDDTYTVNVNKDLVDDDRKLSVFGMFEGLDRNSYDSIKAGLNFKNSGGDSLDLSALNSKKGSKLSGQGNLNLIKTDTQSLDAKAFGENYFLGKDPLYKYGGSLGYINKNGDSLSLTASNTNIDNKYSALGHLNLLNTDTQSLDLGAYGERTSQGNDVHSKFGGSLDYINKKGHNLFVTAQQDSNLGTELTAKGKYAIIDKPDYSLNAQGYWNKNIAKVNAPIETYGTSVSYLNGKGDSATLFTKHTPSLGDELTASGNYNIIHNNDHNLDINGKLSRVFPSNGNVAGYNTYSANIHYLYKDKVTANLGVEHSGLSQRSDISALGKFNLINNENTHFDIFGGITRSISPKLDSGVQPNLGIELETSF